MTDGAPTLGVGFEIDTGSSFDAVVRLENGMDRATANILADAAQIEKATGGMVKLGGATAEVVTFGNASTRAYREAARELARVEKAGEGLIRSLERENAAFGKSKAELRQMRVEERALAAERVGNSDLARRLREQEAELWGKEAFAARQAAIARENAAEEAAMAEMRAQAAVIAQLRERATLEAALERNTGVGRVRATDAGAGFSALAAKAAEDEARATAVATAAAKEHADAHARLQAMVRGSHAAQEANADAAERMRISTDPLYAATKRLNDEIAESTRLYYAGATAPAEYARQQAVLQQRLQQTVVAHDAEHAAMRRGIGTMTQLSFQANDIVTMAMSGAAPMQIFATQIGQIVQVAQMADGGVKGFSKELGSLALRFAPLAAVASVAGVAIWRFQDGLDDSNGKAFASTLGLTRQEMKKLGDTSITTGDLVKGLWETIEDRSGLDFDGKKLIDYFFSPNDAQQVGNFVAEIYALFAGGYKGVVTIWGRLPAAMGDAAIQAVNAAAGAIEGLVNKSIEALNALARRANDLLGVEMFGQISAVEVARMANPYEGAGKAAIGAFVQGFADEKQTALNAMKSFMGDVAKNADVARDERLLKKAKEIKADRPDKKDRPDRRAEQLAREAQAIEAQIRNLYALANAYRISGAEALIAEARVKAESDAIKKRADITEMVERQIRLAIAQRVADAAKSNAAIREQVAAQRSVNEMVAAGLAPAERAAELVKGQIDDLPLLAALQVAQQRGYADEIRAATMALEDQRKARADAQAEAEQANFNASKAAGANRLAELREELRLVGATDAARNIALATLKATQEAEATYSDPARRAQYIQQQIDIAKATEDVASAQRALNSELTFTADRWDAIAGNVQNAAQGMADAFGDAGRSLGDIAAIYADYRAEEERAQLVHKANLDIAKTQSERDRENHLFALRTATAQIGLYGDMASAAQGFFSKNSDGYKAMTTAVKVFRAVEFALSVRAMAQDALATATAVANGAVRIAKLAYEGVAAQAKLPFPLNLAAMAATGAALAALGVSVASSFGGKGDRPEPSNNGTGTVLGDGKAQSESIKRAIDALKEVDTLMLGTSRDMLASLRSIEGQIGGVAALVVRAGNVNADLGVKEGFKPNLIGSLLGNIPLVGGLLSSLFGSKTEITGGGIFGGAQSLGSILSGGFDASYYSDIKKTKKFLGIKTGTSYSTKYSGADAGLESQFTAILREFNNAIVAAAGPLGAATSEIQQRLNGFVVNIGKIDLKGLTGAQIEEKLNAVFGAAADNMARAAFPGIERFQQVGEGLFETLVRVASTVEAVSGALDQLGAASQGLSLDAKVALAAQFESLGAMTGAVQTYFERFYTAEEQAAARTSQFQKVFASLGLTMPGSLAGFRALVEAQDLTTEAGRETYATLLQLAPAFADLQSAMNGARSAADILAERADLERKLLELQGNTAALRELELAKLDESNRALQMQIWAMQDAQEAARAADELRKAWGDVGTSIAEEVRRIRGLSEPGGEGGFASLMGQFNAATAAARGGDQDAAKSLPGLSQALLRAAGLSATSRQELDRIQAQTAASLEQTMRAIAAMSGNPAARTADQWVDAAGGSQAAGSSSATNDNLIAEVKALRAEVAGLRADNNAGHAENAAANKKTAQILDRATQQSGGDALSVEIAA